jgi:hypothetical protein
VPGNVNELGIVSLDEPQKKCCWRLWLARF